MHAQARWVLSVHTVLFGTLRSVLREYMHERYFKIAGVLVLLENETRRNSSSQLLENETRRGVVCDHTCRVW